MSYRPRAVAFVPVATLLLSLVPSGPIAAAPIQNDAARIWSDTFTDATGVTLSNVVHDAPNAQLILDRDVLPLSSVGATLGIPGSGRALRTLVDGGRLYVAAGNEGLRIYDLADPLNPTLLGALATTSAADVAVYGTIAYVADGASGVQVIDISNPAAPSLVTTLATAGIDVALDIAGSRLFVAMGDAGMRSYDLTAPAAPVLEGSLVPGNGSSVDIDVVGSTAYLAQQAILGVGAGMVAVDVSVPATPTLTGTLITPEDGLGIVIDGAYAFLANSTAGVDVIDISNPAVPASIIVLGTATAAQGVEVDGTMLSAALGSAGVQLFDISSPATPVATQLLDTPGTAHALDLDSNVGYVADESTVTIINVPDGSVATIDSIAALPTGTVTELVLSGGILYVAEDAAGVATYQVNADGTLTFMDSFATGGPAVGIALAGTTLFVATTAGGLDAIDASDPFNLSLLDNEPIADAQDVAIIGNRAYVAAGLGGVRVVNIADPSAMLAVTTLAVAGNVATILAGTAPAVYAGTLSGNVVTLNATNVDAPAIAATDAVGGPVEDLALDGSLLAAAATDAAVLFSVGIPLAPSITFTINALDAVHGVALSGDTLAAVSTAPASVAYYDISGAPAPRGTLGLPGAGLDVLLSGSTTFVAASSAIVVIGAAYLPTGTATSVVITPASVTTWNEVIITDDVPAGAALTYDILTAGGAVIPGYAGLLPTAGRIDISGINAGTNPSIRLRANFVSTASQDASPALLDWMVTWDSACLTATSPIDGATAVQRNTDIVLTFDEAINLASLLYTVTPAQTFTATIDATNTIVTLTPTSELAANTTYTVTIDYVETAAGNRVTCFAVPNPFDFTTGAYSGPFIVATTPVDGATGVIRNADVVVTFSDPMDTASVVFTCSAGGPFTVVWSAGNTVATYTPSVLYPANATVTCNVVSADDALGRPIQPGPVPNPWSFTTGAYGIPYIVSTTPADGATDVDRLADVIVTFSDPMNTATVTFTCDAGGPYTVVWSAGDTVATFTHTTLWPASADVTCEVTGGQDMLGRSLQSGPVPNPWTFTTSTVARPYIVATNPADGAVNVDRLADIVVTYSDPMATATLSCSIGGPYTMTLDGTGTIATFSHAVLWPANMAITCTAGGTDTGGRTVQTSLVPNPWTFTTGPVAHPYIVSTNPADGATNVDRLADVIVTFSDPMQLALLTLNCSSGGPFAATLDGTGTIATFSHNALWPANANVTCTAGGTDTLGRPVQTSLVPNPWTFTTGPIARPYIVSTVPVNGATGVALTACVSVTFSDPMNTGTLIYSSSFAGPWTVTWGAGDTVATFCHANAFLPSTTYTFSIDAISDTLGRPVQTSLVPNPFSFTTIAGPGGTGTEFTITATIGGSTSSNRRGGYGSSAVDRDDDDDDDDNDRGDCRFRDVPEQYWAFDYIRDICTRGITDGYPDDTYRPEIPVSRAEFLKFVMEMNDINPSSSTSTRYPDVYAGHTLAGYIARGTELGIVTGYPDGLFRPNIPVTRAEAIKILFNGAGIRVGSDTSTSFVDVQATDWFATFVSFAERNQIVDGRNDRIFAPYANLTRAEAAKIIMNAIEYKEEH